MTTKSLTQGRQAHTTHVELKQNTGKPDINDKHPLITCAPHLMGGHAHLKSNKVTVEQVLRALARERGEAPLVLHSGLKLPGDDVQAVLAYGIDVFEHLSRMFAELDRLRRMIPQREGGKP